MLPIDIYKSFELKVNKNSTNTNIQVPLGVFVTIWNEQKRQWLDDKAKLKESSNYIEDIEELLELDINLKVVKSYSDKSIFELPENYFRRVTSYSLANKGNCKNKKIYNKIVKPKDRDSYLQNSDFSPSFEWEQTISVLNNDKLTVYKDDFEIKNVYLSYYREPKDLDIEGWVKLDGTPSTNILPDLSKFNIEEITNRAVLEVLSNYESAEQYQLAAQRIQRNESII